MRRGFGTGISPLPVNADFRGKDRLI